MIQKIRSIEHLNVQIYEESRTRESKENSEIRNYVYTLINLDKIDKIQMLQFRNSSMHNILYYLYERSCNVYVHTFTCIDNTHEVAYLRREYNVVRIVWLISWSARHDAFNEFAHYYWKILSIK